MKRLCVFAAVVVVLGAGILRSAVGATSPKHVYRCLADTPTTINLLIHNPNGTPANWVAYGRASNGAIVTSFPVGPTPAHGTSGAGFDSSIVAEVTTKANLLITASEGTGDAIHTLRCK